MNKFKYYVFLFIFNSIGNANTLAPGNYSLNINVVDPDGDYPVYLEIDTTDSKTHGIVSYPTYNCSGKLVFKRFGDNLAVYREKILKGADMCANGEYHFHLKGNKLSSPKHFLLENQNYSFKIKKSNFKPDKWLGSNCYHLNNNINNNNKLSKQYSYNYLKKCHKWNLKFGDYFTQSYEEMIVGSINTISDAEDFITYGSDNIFLKRASGKLEDFYYLQATTVSNMDEYLTKYTHGKYAKTVSNSKIALIFSHAKDDLQKLRAFMVDHPDSIYVPKAKANILAIGEAAREKLRLAELDRKEIIRKAQLREQERIRMAALEIQRAKEEKIRLEKQRLADAKALQERYRLAYKSAVDENTVHGYYEFISNNSGAEQVAQARVNISMRYAEIFIDVDDEESIKDYIRFIEQYPSAPQKPKAIDGIFKIVDDDENIAGYEWFIKKYPRSPQRQKVIIGIFDIVYDNDNVAGYEWFITNYPRAPQISRAIKRIHHLSFNKAVDLDTVSAFNTFIIAYPTAKEVSEATNLALKLEKEKYMVGFFSGNEGIDRKARALLIAAKKIENRSLDYRGSNRHGYIIILNRMFNLLESEFNESEATLRHFESMEFKRFVQTFKSTMRDIQQSLYNIENNAADLLQVSRQGFADADADRDMAQYQTNKKTEWDKIMHYQDKGYL